MVNNLKTQMISIVERDEEGRVQGGVKFWWTEGSAIYLYQEWDYRASGAENGTVNPDPMYKDLLTTVKESWLEQVNMVFEDPDNPVNYDYR